ncbi:hypothetical protein L226DRAFT_530251 [Lentinus tigrinus ALCF2SS1-7]|uniref:Uncharacterized protein n=1 Tax=Lentinus tigrinus ALCF2SS1-6 TaxID=1328759 RepID=A0A5C2SSL8_9APHY|nr:hypothetical protein L227DRAFT_648905 [Lentinus tigrinus ALCF2SS1-6]RPD80058.1 hypothetical protein L226DRAFT_530251 [Lentinus tigrinus ALCF2SS1-7]
MAPLIVRTSQDDLDNSTFNYVPVIAGVAGGIMGLFLLTFIVVVIVRRRHGYFLPVYSYVTPARTSSDLDDHHRRQASTSHELQAQHHHFDAHDSAVQSGMMISHGKASDLSTSVSDPPPYSGP